MKRGLGVLVVGIVVGYVGSFVASWVSLRRINSAAARRGWL
jgi:hypothetical protein